MHISFVVCIQSAFSMEIAITVDDLPIAGELPPNLTRTDIANKMLEVFEKHHITSVYGLINGVNTNDSEGWEILQTWVKAGQLLGNHTFTHLDLAQTESTSYITDIIKNESILKKLMGHKDYRYFRYPYLSEGNTQEKRDNVRQFLFNKGYKIAPVTVDFFEYEWNEPYTRCVNKNDLKSIEWLKQTYLEQAENALTIAHELSVMLFKRDIKNVLLIHINAMSTNMLDDLLTLYEKHNVRFISLGEVLSDEIYGINPNIVRDRPYTFLNQVRLSQKLDNPDIVNELYNTLPENKLEQICQS